MTSTRHALAALAFCSVAAITTQASANPWRAKWLPSGTSSRFTINGNEAVCHFAGYIGNATWHKGRWNCAGKTSGFKLLSGSEDYRTIHYSSSSGWVPAHTVYDEVDDLGLCLARLNIGGTTRRMAGKLTRGSTNCKVKLLGKWRTYTNFDFIVTKQDAISHNNTWRTHNAADQWSDPFTAIRMGNDSVMCKASFGGKSWVGRTFEGSPPGKSNGRYCKIVYRPSRNTTATYKYVSSHKVFLNNKPNKAGALYWAPNSVPSADRHLVHSGQATCKKGSKVGVWLFPGGCRHPGYNISSSFKVLAER